MKVIKQLVARVQDTVRHLPVEVDYSAIEGAEVQLTPRLRPVQRTIDGLEFVNTMRSNIGAGEKKGVCVPRREVLQGQWSLRTFI